MGKHLSRPKRWAAAAQAAQTALEKLRGAKDELEQACSDLRDIQSEFEDWKDSLPENLQNSPLGEKLQTVCDISIPDEDNIDLSEYESAIDEAESADLPLGFGRD